MKTPAASSLCRAAAVLCLGLFALPAAGRAQASKPGWGVNQAQALAQAKAEKKMVLMDFTGSDWCGWCKKMDQEIYATPAFQRYAQANLVLVELDFPQRKLLSTATKQQNASLANQYGVNGYPTTVLLDSEGKTLGVSSGYYPGGAAAFIAALEKMKADGPTAAQDAPRPQPTPPARTTTNPLGNTRVQGTGGL